MRRIAIASLFIGTLIAPRSFGYVNPECGDESANEGVTRASAVTRRQAGGEAAVVTAKNPVLGGDHPDPDVLRVVGAGGEVTYYLTATSDTGGDIPIYTSPDLLHWTKAPAGAFHRTSAPGASMAINGAHYCQLWAPQLVALGPRSYMLTFTGRRYDAPQSACSLYNNDSGVYFAWSDSPFGPFARADRPWEPLPAGAERADTRTVVHEDLPHSPLSASPDCPGGACDEILRLDSAYFHDEPTGRNFMAYSWYTNSPPRTAWERDNHGEHVQIVELDPQNPSMLRRDEPLKLLVGNPHDKKTLARLASSCTRCGEMLSMTKGRYGEETVHEGRSWGVNEGASLFRRGEYVYLLMSGSAWDSAYYHVFWAAAKRVEDLATDSPRRIVGRYLVPSRGESFGHGSAVLGPDGKNWYYVHHRLRHGACKSSDSCARDVWTSPIEFEDRGDGRGDVHIKARFPAEDPGVVVTLPRLSGGPALPMAAQEQGASAADLH
jgi:beta-xylosidase